VIKVLDLEMHMQNLKDCRCTERARMQNQMIADGESVIDHESQSRPI